MWKTVKLSEVCSIKSGNSIAVKEKSDLFTNVLGLPYVATKDVGFDGSIDYDNGICIPPQHLKRFKISPAGSTLVCAEGGSAGRKIAFSTNDCCYVNKLLSITPSKSLEARYIYYYALSDEFQSQFKTAIHGLIGGVSLNKIKEFTITVPSVAEQKRIVAKLDAAFAQIEKAIDAEKSKQVQIDSLEVSIVNRTLERFSSHLEYIRLEELCTKISDGVHKKPVYQNCGVPFLKINNLTESEGISFENISYISQSDHEQFIKRTHPEKGDILITKDGTIGVVRQIETDREFSIFVSLALVKPKDKKNSNYLTHVLRSAYCQNQLNPSGAALKHIYLKDLRKLVIPISSDAINKKIVDEFDNLNEQVLLVRDLMNRKIQQLMALKSAMLVKEFQPPTSEAA